MPTAPIQLVAIDLDGTLLNDEKLVSDHTATALRCLAERHIQVIIASARPPRSVRHIYKQLELRTLQINYNGALIWDEPNRLALYHQPLSPDLVQQVVRDTRSQWPDLIVSCEIEDKWFTDRVDDRYVTETARLFPPNTIAPFDAFCHMHVTKLMLHADPSVIDRVEQFTRTTYATRAAVVRQDADLLQIAERNVSKAATLKRVVEHYGLSMQNVLAIGDAPNDVEMLQCAGIAVAMDNAYAEVKSVAHWVAPSNNDHGVHAALKRYGLCE